MESAPSPGKPHERFFFPRDFVVLKVESTLFDIPTFILSKHSPKFEKLLLSRASSLVGETAIQVKDTRSIDFERILTILFPAVPGKLELSTREEWTSVLTVAHNWEFFEIKKLAISQLEPIATAVDKVALGLAYAVPNWARDGYTELCRRAEPVSKEEARRLGLDAAIDISNIRHYLRNEDLRVDGNSAVEAIFSRYGHILDKNTVVPYLRASLNESIQLEGQEESAPGLLPTSHPRPAFPSAFGVRRPSSLFSVPDGHRVQSSGSSSIFGFGTSAGQPVSSRTDSTQSVSHFASFGVAVSRNSAKPSSLFPVPATSNPTHCQPGEQPRQEPQANGENTKGGFGYSFGSSHT